MRDPTTKLGGVASGIAHHFGLDPAVVRIAFVVMTFFTGTGIIAYLAGWVLIPQAQHWPRPPGGEVRSLQSLGGRDLGIALGVVGVLIVLAIGPGGPSMVLIPAILIGGGVWLLMQPPSEGQHPSGPTTAPAAGAATATTVPTDRAGQADTVTGPGPAPGPAPSGGAGPYWAPVPAPPRRRHRGLIAVLLGVLGTLLVLLLLLVGTIVWAVGQFGDPAELTYRPATLEQLDNIPDPIDEDGASLVIDLTGIDATEWAGQAEPVEIRANIDFGAIEVVVPEGVETSVAADVGVGEVLVFDESRGGFGREFDIHPENPDLELDLDVGIGEIVVDREAAG